MLMRLVAILSNYFNIHNSKFIIVDQPLIIQWILSRRNTLNHSLKNTSPIWTSFLTKPTNSAITTKTRNQKPKNYTTNTAAVPASTSKAPTSPASVSSPDPKEKKLSVIKVVRPVPVEGALPKTISFAKSKKEKRKKQNEKEADPETNSSNHKTAVVKSA